jgi:hypothetical protein
LADWATISSLATAGGTLVLAVATFSSVRSANRSARTAERSLLAQQRPVLIPSREDDPPGRVMFGDGYRVTVEGHGGAIEVAGDQIYMSIGLRNGGNGLAVLHGWRAAAQVDVVPAPEPPELEDFQRQQIDLYIPSDGSAFWLGAIRDPEHERHGEIAAAVAEGDRVIVDLLYGDHEGGQRAIARFGVTVNEQGKRYANVIRYWNIDREDPR